MAVYEYRSYSRSCFLHTFLLKRTRNGIRIGQGSSKWSHEEPPLLQAPPLLPSPPLFTDAANGREYLQMNGLHHQPSLWSTCYQDLRWVSPAFDARTEFRSKCGGVVFRYLKPTTAKTVRTKVFHSAKSQEDEAASNDSYWVTSGWKLTKIIMIKRISYYTNQQPQSWNLVSVPLLLRSFQLTILPMNCSHDWPLITDTSINKTHPLTHLLLGRIVTNEVIEISKNIGSPSKHIHVSICRWKHWRSQYLGARITYASQLPPIRKRRVIKADTHIQFSLIRELAAHGAPPQGAFGLRPLLPPSQLQKLLSNIGIKLKSPNRCLF